MTEHPVGPSKLCVSRNLAPASENVVPSTQLCRNAEVVQHIHNWSREGFISVESTVDRRRHEAEIEIAKIVVHRTAAGNPPDNRDPARCNNARIHFLDRILI